VTDQPRYQPRYQPTLTSWDDYPVHQVAETIRHAATSDRNFYDRYYFNCHGSAADLMLITGIGPYPNLGTQDAYVVVRRGQDHRVVRASRPLTDRMDTSVGPFHVEVLEPLKKLRVVLDANEHDLAYDLTWEGAIPAYEEPRQFIRKHGRVLFDTRRLAQTGTWTGTIEVAGESIEVTPDRWQGTRDRSWGVRPVGEPEPAGIREGEGQMSGMWNYAPIQFDAYSILYICQETDDGDRPLEEAVRVWNDPGRQPDFLGRPEHHHTLVPGTRKILQGRITFPEAPDGPIEVDITSLLECAVAIGTGYGLDADWRHGMYHGRDLVVQGLHLSYDDAEDQARLEQPWGIVDHVARFELTEGGTTITGHGLHEHGFFGPYSRYGLEGYDGMAP